MNGWEDNQALLARLMEPDEPTPYDFLCVALAEGPPDEEVGVLAARILIELCERYTLVPRWLVSTAPVMETVAVEGEML